MCRELTATLRALFFGDGCFKGAFQILVRFRANLISVNAGSSEQISTRDFPLKTLTQTEKWSCGHK